MDLCLRGSQINLVSRQKPKPKYSSQTNLHNSLPLSRPRSATLFQKRSRSSPFLHRPQSADPKFGRAAGSACGHYSNENDFPAVKFSRQNKRFESVSSSSLLKLLLDEPIKRSWLCRSSADNQSELSSCRKTPPSYSSLTKRTRTESVGSSSVEGDTSERLMRLSLSASDRRKSCTSASSMSQLAQDKYSNNSTTARASSNEYWFTSTSTAMSSSTLLPKATKPDLPGRVSFCKSDTQHDVDSSDCDNDKQEQYQQSAGADSKIADCSISAPGPLALPSFSHSAKLESTAKSAANQAASLSAPASASSLKKSVHFGAAGAEEVYAETYEYPKCPSENCSCSTRSSSTASVHDGLEVKCACASLNCKYALEAGSRPHMADLELSEAPLEPDVHSASRSSVPIEESAVIREYKNAVAEQLENSIVRNMLEEAKPTTSSFSALNNAELPAYLEKYSAPVSTHVNLEKQNNLSEAKSSPTYKMPNKRNLVANTNEELAKRENNFAQLLEDSATYASSSEAVINNYLKVASSAPSISKKQENNATAMGQAAQQRGSSKKVKPPSVLNAKNKPASAPSAERAKLKKAISFGSLREDSNLNEFHLDKVDSWMSMHQDAMAGQTAPRQASIESDYEKLRKESLQLLLDGMEDSEQMDSASQVSTKSEENSQEDSTYDEIVSVIKEIEEDKKQDNFAERASSEIELKLNVEVEPAQRRETVAEASGSQPSPDKYKDILSYLDNVEDSCDKTLLETRRSMPDSNRSEVEFIVEPDIAEDVPKLSELLMLPNHQLARRVIALSLRANELANAMHLSKEHVLKIRTEKQKSIRAEKANSTTRMRDQKKHYETIVKRHQGFIEQLLKDKGSLCEKIAALTRRLESQNQAWEHKLETEVARVKETTMAGEKIRRERWVRENTKRIKELTVKGLEAEINRMNNEHQGQVTELKRAHQQQMLDALEEARIRHEQIENGIRESCAQDRETIIEKERMAIRERFERQLEEEHKSFDEQKQKLCEDFTAERERLQHELKAKEVDYQKRREEMQREKDGDLEQAITELQEKMSRQDEKYQNRINTIEKQYEADFELWKRDYENSCKLVQVERENNIRQHYRAERDRQIDAIVSRMDAEALKNADEFELKVSRLKEKYEKDLEGLENAEKSLREKYTETRGKLAEADAQVRNGQAELKQLHIELEHSKRMCSDILAERDQVRDNLRSEVQAEVSTLKTERDNEIQRIHKRVQQAIEKKDATIDILQKENGSLRERCLKLEAVIRQQRKDYCVK